VAVGGTHVPAPLKRLEGARKDLSIEYDSLGRPELATQFRVLVAVRFVGSE